MRDFKDTPLSAPLRIGTPSRFADFPWWSLALWYGLAALAVSLEPDPSGLNMSFHWIYLIQGQAIALSVRFLLPLLLLPFRPRTSLPGLLRISLGTSLVWLWTSPLAWIWSSPLGGITLGLGREILWFALLIHGAGLLRPSHRGAKIAVWALLGLLGPALSLGLQSIPDLVRVQGIRMDNLSSGRVAPGTPELAEGFVLRGRWTLVGPPTVLDPQRLLLGDRQRVIDSRGDTLVVEVRWASVPAPADTFGSSIPDASEGSRIDALLASIPAQSPDSLKILMLHHLVHTSIRYDRTFFPGNSDAILARGTGDCKAFAHLMTEGARRLGFRAREVRGLLASPDGYYAHAWTSIELDGRWSDWDPTSAVPFPDARYLRFSVPQIATGAFDGELGIFALRDVEFKSLEVGR
ncbi:MAG: transglutaminase domain-containing protein [Fibrobacteria bacterium]|nr:transglutaminase domain-containing protein [Fibrobacteria bacterium]